MKIPTTLFLLIFPLFLFPLIVHAFGPASDTSVSQPAGTPENPNVLASVADMMCRHLIPGTPRYNKCLSGYGVSPDTPSNPALKSILGAKDPQAVVDQLKLAYGSGIVPNEQDRDALRDLIVQANASLSSGIPLRSPTSSTGASSSP